MIRFLQNLSTTKKALLATGIAFGLIGIVYLSKPEWFQKEVKEVKNSKA